MRKRRLWPRVVIIAFVWLISGAILQTAICWLIAADVFRGTLFMQPAGVFLIDDEKVAQSEEPIVFQRYRFVDHVWGVKGEPPFLPSLDTLPHSSLPTWMLDHDTIGVYESLFEEEDTVTFSITFRYDTAYGWPARGMFWTNMAYADTVSPISEYKPTFKPTEEIVRGMPATTLFPNAPSDSILPTAIDLPGFTFNTLVWGSPLGLPLATLLILMPLARHHLRARRGQCPDCAYRLDGVQADACPECGRTIR